MSEVLHGQLGTVDGIHLPYAGAHANETARLTDTYDGSDVGKIYRQLDDDSIWLLVAHDPVSFEEVTGGTPVGVSAPDTPFYLMPQDFRPYDEWMVNGNGTRMHARGCLSTYYGLEGRDSGSDNTYRNNQCAQWNRTGTSVDSYAVFEHRLNANGNPWDPTTYAYTICHKMSVRSSSDISFGAMIGAQYAITSSNFSADADHYGIVYDTGRSDTNFVFQMYLNSSTYLSQPSSVAVASETPYWFVFEANPADGELTLRILNDNGTRLDSHTFDTTGMSVSATARYVQFGGCTRSGAQKYFDHYGGFVLGGSMGFGQGTG